jgi:3'-phosphoadenosine 5'-phosphosulfate (PAPS) 3'-phosphatase
VEDLGLAFEVADVAAGPALEYFEAGVSVALKGDGTPVTEADRAVERLVRERLAAARPGDALLGEELGDSRSLIGSGSSIDRRYGVLRSTGSELAGAVGAGGCREHQGRGGRSARVRPLLVGDPRRWRVRVVVAARD